MPKVITVTSSMGTKWEAYSQTMLWSVVPEWRRYIVDGREDWSPTRFIDMIIEEQVDYVVHVDEDCFVVSREALLNVIESLESDRSLVAAGVPDGGYYYRNFNPAALNLFFVVFRADVLRKAWQKKEKWAQIHFVAEFGEEVFRQIPKLDLGRVNWGKSEPYYPLFWSILSDGGKFLYLTEELYKPRYSSRVRTPSGLIVAEHMWYLREWFSHETMTGHDCPNFMRFANWESEWRLKHGASVKLRAMLGIMRIKRIARRLLR